MMGGAGETGVYLGRLAFCAFLGLSIFFLCTRPFVNGKWRKMPLDICVRSGRTSSRAVGHAHICFLGTSKVDSKYMRLKREQSSNKRRSKEVGGLL